MERLESGAPPVLALSAARRHPVCHLREIAARRLRGQRQLLRLTDALLHPAGAVGARLRAAGPAHAAMLTQLAAKVAAYTVGQVLNERLGRPLRGFAELLI